MTNDGQHKRLVGVSGSYRGNEFYIEKDEYLIGRAPDCDLVISEKTVSGKHAKLVRNGDQFELMDLNSTNGTFVNGARIQRKTLRTDDVIKFDVFEFRYLNPEEVARTMISQAPDFSREAARPPVAPAAPAQEAGQPAVEQSYSPDRRYQSPRPAGSTPAPGPEAPRPFSQPPLPTGHGHLPLGLIIGLLFAVAILYGGYLTATAMTVTMEFNFLDLIRNVAIIAPVLFTHWAWVGADIVWNAGMVIILVSILLAPMFGGLLTRIIGRKGAFLSALLFSICFTAVLYVAQFIAMGFDAFSFESKYMSLTGIFASPTAVLVVIGYTLGVVFCLSFLMAMLIRKR